MPHLNEETGDYLAAARDLQARQVEYLQRGDVPGLVNALYTEDARFDSFDVHAAGRDAVAGVIELYLQRTAGLGRRTVETFTAGRDYIWFELAMETPAGPVRTYEVKFLREGRTALELFGVKEGRLWEPDDFAGARLPDTAAAMALHDTYVSDGKISLQLVGSLEGAIPTDAVGTGERVGAARSGSGEGRPA